RGEAIGLAGEEARQIYGGGCDLWGRNTVMAPRAIAFLNLSLERQELWSLSIEEKGMLFPCHLLVAPPSSLP
ncbi:hypothetical protein GOODEAATRI_017060, partial [Goodea atripinnis]